MSSSHPPGAATPSKKGFSLTLGVLLALGGLLVVAGLAVLAGGLILVRGARQAGPEVGLAAARRLASSHPDLEVVGVDRAAGKVTLRQKSSGKTLTLNLEEIRQGKISFETGESDPGETALEAAGKPIEGRSGTVERPAGDEVRLPAWLPVYAGAEVKGSTRSRIGDDELVSLILLTEDPVERVSAFYRGVLERAGFTVDLSSHATGGRADLISAASSDGKRRASVIVGREEEGTVITLTAQERP
jgi:hypothetical protein